MEVLTNNIYFQEITLKHFIQPLILRAKIEDMATKPIEVLANEASIIIEATISPELEDMFNRYDITRRGRAAWAISATEDNARTINSFLKEYISTFVPFTLVSSDNGSWSSVNKLSCTETAYNIARFDLHNHPNRANSLFVDSNGERTELYQMFRDANLTVPRFSFSDEQTDVLAETYSSIYEDYRFRREMEAKGFDYEEYVKAQIPLGGLVVELKNNMLWMRLASGSRILSALNDKIDVSGMRNIADRRSSRNINISEFLNVYDTMDEIHSNELIWSESTQEVIEFIKEVDGKVCVGYAPNKPASVIVTKGGSVPKSRFDKGLSNFPVNQPTATTMERVLKMQKENKQIDFLFHPSLTDISNMVNVKPYEDDRLRPYQKEAVGLHLATSVGYLNSCSPGMGKTVMQLVSMSVRAQSIPYYRGVIITEGNVTEQWKEHAPTWFPEAEVVTIKNSKDTDSLIKGLSSENPVIILLTYAQTLNAFKELELRQQREESLAGMRFEERIALLKAEPMVSTVGSLLLDTYWNDIAADEAVVIRNDSSKQAKALWKMRANSEVAVALTATPINKSPDDIARLISWVRNDRNLFSGQSLTELYDTTSAEGAKELFNIFGPIVFRRDISEIKDELPNVGKPEVLLLDGNEAEIALNHAAEKELKRCYFELVEAMKNLKEADGISAEELAEARENLKNARGGWLGGTQLARMATSDPAAILESESVGAALLTGQGLVDAALEDEPTKRARFVSEMHKRVGKGEQVVAFVEFETVARLLVKTLQENGINAAAFTGKNARVRDTARKQFQEGKLDVLVCTQAGERGLTLHKASAVYHYDIPWTLEKIIQRTGRSIRIGSENEHVDIVFMVMKNTIEQRMADNLVELGVASTLIMDSSRGVDVKGTETMSALGGLMSAMTKTSDNKNLIKFGKEILNV